MMDAYGPLARYVAAATLARGADAGAAVGLVLLAAAPATGLHRGAAVGGVLAAGLTAPHLGGPWVARRLDAARDGRRLLAAACLTYGAALAAAALALGHAPVVLVGAAVVVAGASGPLLTGGLSSRLAAIAPPQPRAQRGAQGLDATTYGLAGTGGPALVAALAALAGPLAALLALALAAAGAGAVTLTLPPDARDAGQTGHDPDPLTVRATLRLVAGHGPLRRVALLTTATAFAFGGLAVLAVALGHRLGGSGAALVATYGAGILAGSLAVTAVPLRREPEADAARWAVAMAAALALVAAAPSYGLAVAAFVLAGLVTAPQTTATLAARNRYAPDAARAQVFVTLAGLKVAAAAAGTALAGAALALGPARARPRRRRGRARHDRRRGRRPPPRDSGRARPDTIILPDDGGSSGGRMTLRTPVRQRSRP